MRKARVKTSSRRGTKMEMEEINEDDFDNMPSLFETTLSRPRSTPLIGTADSLPSAAHILRDEDDEADDDEADVLVDIELVDIEDDAVASASLQKHEQHRNATRRSKHNERRETRRRERPQRRHLHQTSRQHHLHQTSVWLKDGSDEHVLHSHDGSQLDLEDLENTDIGTTTVASAATNSRSEVQRLRRERRKKRMELRKGKRRSQRGSKDFGTSRFHANSAWCPIPTALPKSPKSPNKIKTRPQSSGGLDLFDAAMSQS